MDPTEPQPEHYCDDPQCLRPVVPLTAENEMVVHPKFRAPVLDSAFTPVTVAEQTWRIHAGCFNPNRHVRVQA